MQEAERGRDFIERSVRTLYRFAWRERGLLRLRMASNAERGELHPRRQRDFMGELVKEAAGVLSAHVEVDELDTRLAAQGLASMAVRYALMSDSEVQWLTDLEPDAARDEVEEFMVRAGRRLLRPSDG